MAGGDRKDSWGEEELMRAALESAEKRSPPAPVAGKTAEGTLTPKADPLTPQEKVFVEAYLRTGKKRDSAAIAGYKNPAEAAYRAMKRPRVQEALRGAVETRVDASEMSRAYIIKKHIEIIEGNNLLARIRSLDQIAKLQGYFAPIKHQTIPGQEGNPYAQLTETLRASGAAFTNEEKAQLRVQLIVDLASIQEALALLGDGEKVS